jgi:hypothetical protein
MACPKRHNNLHSLKRSLAKAAAEISLVMACTTIAELPERLEACAEVEGGHFQ